MAKKGDDYEIGYRRPPRETRFKKGQSGNPNGRRKKKRASFAEVFGEALNERITVAIKGQARSLSMQELIVEQLGEKAVKGDRRALDILLKLREGGEGSEGFDSLTIYLNETDWRI
jgi:hypothetical protein